MIGGVNLVSFKLVNCGDHRQRRNFSRIRSSYELKDLLEIQKKSYNWFIETGIKEVLQAFSPVANFCITSSFSLAVILPCKSPNL